MSHFDPLDLRGQESAKRKKDDLSRLAAEQQDEDINWLMSNKAGRRIAWRLLERTGVFRSSFTGNSETFFREGQRNVGLMLLDQIHRVAPDLYATMLKECTNDAGNDDDGSDRNAH